MKSDKNVDKCNKTNVHRTTQQNSIDMKCEKSRDCTACGRRTVEEDSYSRCQTTKKEKEKKQDVDECDSGPKYVDCRDFILCDCSKGKYSKHFVIDLICYYLPSVNCILFPYETIECTKDVVLVNA